MDFSFSFFVYKVDGKCGLIVGIVLLCWHSFLGSFTVHCTILATLPKPFMGNTDAL